MNENFKKNAESYVRAIDRKSAKLTALFKECEEYEKKQDKYSDLIADTKKKIEEQRESIANSYKFLGVLCYYQLKEESKGLSDKAGEWW